MRNFFTLIISIAISGCASVGPTSEKVSDADIETFFRPPGENTASIFFACGNWKTESWLMKSANALPICALQVNSQAFKKVWRDQVGRVDLPPGVYKLQGAPTDSLASYIPLQIEVKNQELIFITQNLLQNIGPLGGVGGFVHSLEWSKQDVMQTVRKLQPVKMAD